VLVTDRGTVDNYAYYLRACGMVDRYAIEPLVRTWGATYDLVVRLIPDVPLRADRMRSTADAFREEIDAILDRVLPDLVPPDRLVPLPASGVTDEFDWLPLAERLAAAVDQPLLAEGVVLKRKRSRRRPVAAPSAPTSDDSQLGLGLGYPSGATRADTRDHVGAAEEG
jgi:hypothetical protein